ncbi:MAG TPA: hypothetical protein VD768_08840 [Sphingomicrobium sp.]|nr:hypothetical protein [Sphingomicrobium sp.]
MPEEWLEIAHINFDKVILHGRVTAGRDEHGCRLERDVEHVLTLDQADAVSNLSARHHREMQKLLRSFVPEERIVAAPRLTPTPATGAA